MKEIFSSITLALMIMSTHALSQECMTGDHEESGAKCTQQEGATEAGRCSECIKKANNRDRFANSRVDVDPTGGVISHDGDKGEQIQ